jgi:hypothetical protein
MLDGIEGGVLYVDDCGSRYVDGCDGCDVDDGSGVHFPGPRGDGRAEEIRAEYVERQQRHAIWSYYDFRCNLLVAEAAREGADEISFFPIKKRAMADTIAFFAQAGCPAQMVHETIEEYLRHRETLTTIVCGDGRCVEVEWHEDIPGKRALLIGSYRGIKWIVNRLPSRVTVDGIDYLDLTWGEVEPFKTIYRQVEVHWQYTMQACL